MISAFAATCLFLQHLLIFQVHIGNANSLLPKVTKELHIKVWAQLKAPTPSTTTTTTTSKAAIQINAETPTTQMEETTTTQEITTATDIALPAGLPIRLLSAEGALSTTPDTTTTTTHVATTLKEVQPIRFGTALTLDCCSAYSADGQEVERGYRFFVEWANLIYGGVHVQGQRRPIELVLVDDRSSKELARSITESLVAQNVGIFLGPASSELSEAAADVVNASDGVMVTPSAASPSIFEDGSQIFGTLGPAALHFKPVFRIWAQLGVRSVIAVQDEAPLSHDMCDGLPMLSSEHGIELNSTLTMPAGTNLSEFLRINLASRGAIPDALVACVFEEHCQHMMKGLQQHDINFQAIAFSTCAATAHFLPELGDAARFVMGTTPWVPNAFTSSWPSTFSGFSSADFGHLYRMRYGLQPSYQFYSAFAAGLAVVAAIEVADSVTAPEIASALRRLDLTTMFGTVSFDEAGMNTRETLVVQYVATGSTYKQIFSEADMVYPMPPWSSRPCFAHSHDGLKNGLLDRDDERCDECPKGQLPLWTSNAWFGSPARKCSPVVCGPGHEQHDDGSCDLCKAGTYENSNRTCIDCPVGRFSSSNGTTTCDWCLPGSFASHVGQSECDLCPPGYEAPKVGQEQCLPCSRGTNASNPGTAICELCAEGSFNHGDGSLVCVLCQAGKYRPQGAESCLECEIGRFQDLEGKAFCHDCPGGTSCDKPGMTFANIAPGWWTLNMGESEDDESWKFFPCSTASFCLANQTCREGHIDILCESCLPGFFRGIISRRCDKCPSLGTNVPALVLVGAIACISTLVLTGWSIQSAEESKAITSILLKLLLNYLTTMAIMGFILQKELKSREDNLGNDESSLDFVNYFCVTILEAFGGLFSLDCLLAPKLSELDNRLVDELAMAPQSQYFDPQYDTARDILVDFHYEIEWRHLIFWCSLPIALSACLVFFGSCCLRIHICRKQELYDEATDFFEHVKTTGWHHAVRKAIQRKRDWHVYSKLYQYRLMGLWHVLPLASLKGCRFYKKFFQECEPLLLVAMFLAYPYVIKAFLRPLSCMEPLGSSFGLRVADSVDLKCYNNDLLFWFSSSCIVFYGFGLPAVSGFLLWKLREKLHKKRFKRTFNFIIGGYEVDRNFWESLVLVRKSLGQIIAALGIEQGLRLLSIISLSLFFSLLHIFYQPFDNRYDELLDGVENLHLAAWVFFGLVVLILHISREPPPTMTWSLLICLLCVHGIFLAKILSCLYRQLRSQIAESIVQHAIHEQHVGLLHMDHQHKLDEPGHRAMRSVEMKVLPEEVLERGPLNRIHRCLLWRHVKQLDRRSYFTMEGRSGLCQIQGNMGSKCTLPPDFLGMAPSEDVISSSAGEPFSVMMPPGVIHPNNQGVLMFVKIVFEALEYIIVNSEISVFSSSLLEFILRAALAFGSDGHPRHVFVAHDIPPSTTGKQMLQVGLWEGATKITKATRENVQTAINNAGEILRTPVLGALNQWMLNSRPETQNSLDSQPSMGRSSTEASLDSEANEEIREIRETLKGQVSFVGDLSKRARLEKDLSERVAHMFDPRIFWRGLTLEDMQLNLSSAIMTKTRADLLLWFEFFEVRWRQEWLHNCREDEGENSKADKEDADKIDEGDDAETKNTEQASTAAKWHWLTSRLTSQREARQLCVLTRLATTNKEASIDVNTAVPVLKAEYDKLQAELVNARQSGTQNQIISMCQQISAEVADLRCRREKIREEIARLSAECQNRGLDTNVIQGSMAAARIPEAVPAVGVSRERASRLEAASQGSSARPGATSQERVPRPENVSEEMQGFANDAFAHLSVLTYTI